MRVVSVCALLVLGCSSALAGLDEKPAPMKPPPISSISEVEGRTLEQWAADLTHADPSVREKAISIIPAYGPSASHLVPLLVKRTQDEDLGPRVRAIMALGVLELIETDKPQVVAAMANILIRDPQSAAKLQAALTLMRFGEEGKPAIPALVSGVNDTGSWQIRKASILALRRIGSDKKNGPDGRATIVLLTAVRDPALQVRLEAVQALGFMDGPKDPALHARVEKALTLLKSDHDKVLSIWAHTSYMAIDKVTDADLAQVAKHLTNNELEVRGQALLAITALGPRAKAYVPKVAAMLEDKDTGIVGAACWGLVSLGEKDPKALAALTDLIARKELDERVRQQAKMALEVLKNAKNPEKTAKP